MVGRGLRINHENKDKVCMIIDNVGNYRKFGLPDKPRNWESMLIEELRMHLSYAKSKSYDYIVDDIKGMYTCCEVSKKLILDFVEEIEYNYGNRPA
jgi:hypothetical protein